MAFADDPGEARRALAGLGLDLPRLLEALELEADLAALRARREALVALIAAVPSAELRRELSDHLGERERALVPDPAERRKLLGDPSEN